MDWAANTVKSLHDHYESYQGHNGPKAYGGVMLREMLDIQLATRYKCLKCSVMVVVPVEQKDAYDLYEGKCPPCYKEGY